MFRVNNSYGVLGLPENANWKQVQSAYRRLVKELHPDGHRDDPERNLKEERLKQVNAAYEQLKKEFAKSAGAGQEPRPAPVDKPKDSPPQKPRSTPSEPRRSTETVSGEDTEAAAQRFWNAVNKARQQTKR